MKAVVVGANGFIGRHVVAHLEQSGWDVFRCTRAGKGLEVGAGRADVRPLGDSLQQLQPYLVVNAAGNGYVPDSWRDSRGDYDANTSLVLDLLETIRARHPLAVFLNLSSAAVYGEPQSLPVTEDHACRPLSPYGWHKRLAELLCEEYTALHGLRTASCRAFSAYGPGQRKLLIWDLMEQIRTQSEVTLRGTGDETRDYIYAPDVAAAIETIARHAPCRGEVWNVASGRATRIAELASALAGVAGFRGRIAFDRRQTPGYPIHWQADVRRLKGLGFDASHGLESGLAATWQWYRSLARD